MTSIRFFNRIKGGNTGMVERRRRPGFGFKSLNYVRVVKIFYRQSFKGDLPAKFAILRQVDLTHSTRSEPGNDPVMPQTLTYQRAFSGIGQQRSNVFDN